MERDETTRIFRSQWCCTSNRNTARRAKTSYMQQERGGSNLSVGAHSENIGVTVIEGVEVEGNKMFGRHRVVDFFDLKRLEVDFGTKGA